MLFSQLKEREYKFTLALRMVLPIFILFLVLIIHSIYSYNSSVGPHFYIELILIFIISIYFIFYLIQNSFNKKITDSISKAFTKEYIYNFIEKELKKDKDFTLVLVSLDNLNEINSRYGVNVSDKIIYETISWVNEFLISKNILNVPIGHIRGSNFIIFLDAQKESYKSIFELMSLKSQDILIDNVEVKILTSIIDTKFSRGIDYLIENLFEQQREKRESQSFIAQDVDPNDYEYSVVNALKRKDFTIYAQNVYNDDKIAFKECSIKLKDENGKILHQKEYLKVLNKLRLLQDYDLTILEKVIQLAKKTGDKYAMHITASTIRNYHSVSQIKDMFYRNNELKGKIYLVFSENEYYSNIEKFNTTLKQLKDIGIKIVIDRVGSLHSSFLYLKDLDIDVIRYATQYSKQSSYRDYENIIDGFGAMARKKGIKVWAKLIEAKEVYEFFKEHKVDYLQGKYLSELEELI